MSIKNYSKEEIVKSMGSQVTIATTEGSGGAVGLFDFENCEYTSDILQASELLTLDEIKNDGNTVFETLVEYIKDEFPNCLDELDTFGVLVDKDTDQNNTHYILVWSE